MGKNRDFTFLYLLNFSLFSHNVRKILSFSVQFLFLVLKSIENGRRGKLDSKWGRKGGDKTKIENLVHWGFREFWRVRL